MSTKSRVWKLIMHRPVPGHCSIGQAEADCVLGLNVDSHKYGESLRCFDVFEGIRGSSKLRITCHRYKVLQSHLFWKGS
jgi:hypothetical protein